MLAVGTTVSAHEGQYDFFDFENYTGNNETLSVVPARGTYGVFGINNRTGDSGDDGITSEATDKGTSLVLVRRYAKYPGVYYSHRYASYDTTETLHSSLSFKINGTISGGYGVFRFRKRGSSSPYNIVVFNDNGTISILDEPIKENGGYVYYSKDKWYNLDVVYDVPSGYCKVRITGDEGLDICREKCSGYEKSLTSIQHVMFETIGDIKDTEKVAKVYLDNWKIETVSRQQSTNAPITFDDFSAGDSGADVPKGYMLTGFVPASTAASGYSAVFTREDEKGRALVLAQNVARPLTLWGTFKNKVVEATVFEADVKVESLNSDTSIYLGNADEGYADALRIKASTGEIFAYGQSLGKRLAVGKSYHITLAFDSTSKCGYLVCSDGTFSTTHKFVSAEIPVTWVGGYKLSLENYSNSAGNTMEALFDNLKLSSGDNIYHLSDSSDYDFDIADYWQCGNDTYMIRMNKPIDTTVMPTVKVNGQTAEFAFVNANTIKVYYPQDEGEVNVKISGIKDTSGASVTKSCELVNIDMTSSLKISNPVFLADRLGIESLTDSVKPGSLTAVVNIKKAND